MAENLGFEITINGISQTINNLSDLNKALKDIAVAIFNAQKAGGDVSGLAEQQRQLLSMKDRLVDLGKGFDFIAEKQQKAFDSLIKNISTESEALQKHLGAMGSGGYEPDRVFGGIAKSIQTTSGINDYNNAIKQAQLSTQDETAALQRWLSTANQRLTEEEKIVAGIRNRVIAESSIPQALNLIAEAEQKHAASATAATRVLNGTKIGASQFSQVALNMNYVLRDSPYFFNNFAMGVMAIGNNLNPLTDSFQRLSREINTAREAGQDVSWMQVLKQNLNGAMGLTMGLSFAVAAFQAVTFAMSKNSDQAKEAKESIEELSKTQYSLNDSLKGIEKSIKNMSFDDLTEQYHKLTIAIREANEEANKPGFWHPLDPIIQASKSVYIPMFNKGGSLYDVLRNAGIIDEETSPKTDPKNDEREKALADIDAIANKVKDAVEKKYTVSQLLSITPAQRKQMSKELDEFLGGWAESAGDHSKQIGNIWVTSDDRKAVAQLKKTIDELDSKEKKPKERVDNQTYLNDILSENEKLELRLRELHNGAIRDKEQKDLAEIKLKYDKDREENDKALRDQQDKLDRMKNNVSKGTLSQKDYDKDAAEFAKFQEKYNGIAKQLKIEEKEAELKVTEEYAQKRADVEIKWQKKIDDANAQHNIDTLQVKLDEIFAKYRQLYEELNKDKGTLDQYDKDNHLTPGTTYNRARASLSAGMSGEEQRAKNEDKKALTETNKLLEYTQSAARTAGNAISNAFLSGKNAIQATIQALEQFVVQMLVTIAVEQAMLELLNFVLPMPSLGAAANVGSGISGPAFGTISGLSGSITSINNNALAGTSKYSNSQSQALNVNVTGKFEAKQDKFVLDFERAKTVVDNRRVGGIS